MNGFIKIHRQITEWEWYDEPNTFRVFIHLLLEANHKDKKWRGMTIKRGQVLVSRSKLAEALGITEQNVRTALAHLKSTNEVTIKSTNRASLVTIENYEKYQVNEKEPTNKSTNELTTDQPATNQPTNKNDKKYIYKTHILTDMVKSYNETCVSLPRCQKLTEKRKQKLRARLKEFTPEQIQEIFAKVEESDFLTGRSGRWKASFDWLMENTENMTKVLEGNYDNRDRDDNTKQRLVEENAGRVSVYNAINDLW